MKLSHALERAHSIPPTAPKAAAKLYNNIEYELALGDYGEEDAQQAETALTYLEGTFPGVRASAHDLEAPPSLSRQANKTLRPEERPALEARTPAQARAEARVNPGGPRGRARRATAIHARSRSRGGYLGRRYQQAGQGIGRSIIHGVEGIVGLVLLSLLVSPRGSQAFTGIFGGLDRFLQDLGNPHNTLFHAGAGGGSHDIPIVPRVSRKKPPPNPPGSKYRIPRPVPFPPLPTPVRPSSPYSPGSPVGDILDPSPGAPTPVEVP